MAPKIVNEGLYDAREAASLLGRVSVETVIRWSTRNAAGQPAVVKPSLKNAFSFVDLVSLAVAVKLHDRGVSDRHLRHGISDLAKRVKSTHPLAQRGVVARLGTCGTAFLWNDDGDWLDLGTGGQGTFRDVVSIDLQRLDFDDVGTAAKWRPALHVVLDPRVQAGAPVVEGTRIPTATIEALNDTESVKEIAEEYDLPVAKVRAAIAFEQRLRAGKGLAA